MAIRCRCSTLKFYLLLR